MTDEVEFAIQVEEEQALAGLAERYAALASQNQDTEAIVEELRTQAIDQGLPLPGGRGLSSVFAWIVERLRSRQLLNDLGEHPAEFEWFALHVPPGSKASLVIENESELAPGFTLKLFGIGFGSGREISFSVKSGFPNRTTCLRFIQHADVHVRRYAIAGLSGRSEVEVTTDIVRLRQQQVKAWKDCPYCGVATNAIDPFEYEVAEQGFDLRESDGEQTRTEQIAIKSTSEAEFAWPLKIPGLSDVVDIGVSVKRGALIRCEVSWHFEPGKFLTPYWKIHRAQELPFWSVL